MKRLGNVRLAALAALLASVRLAAAGEGTDVGTLQAQAEALQSRLDVLQSRRSADDTRPQPLALEARVRDLESRMAERAADEAPFGGGWKDGRFGLQSSDGLRTLQIGGRVQVQGAWQTGDRATREASNDGLFIRRVRLEFTGQADRGIKYELAVDWDKTTGRLRDAALYFTWFDPVNLKVGAFRAPLSHEILQSSKWSPLIEYSLMRNVVPNRDVGMMLYGEPWDRFLYQAALMNGLDTVAAGDMDDDKDALVRVLLTPFRPEKNPWLKGLEFGGSFSWGNQHGPMSGPVTGSKYKVPASGATFYTWNGDMDGSRTRYGAEFLYYAGPFHASGEWLAVEQHVSNPRAGLGRRLFTTRVWYLETGVVLTGEDASYTGVRPRHDFDPREGHWGAFELCARYSNLDADRSAIDEGYATASSASFAEEYAGCINWYLNRAVKVQMMYDHARLSRPGTRSEDTILCRFQIAF